MKKIIIQVLIFTFSCCCFAQTKKTLPEGAFPASVYSLSKDSQISAAYMNSPITETDRIYVNSEGHLQTTNGRLRIFGTNLSEFPQTKEKAVFAAEALANQGYNCIRFHHTDADWTHCFIKRLDNKKRVLDENQLDNFDFFFAELKKRGIYSNINFLTGRIMTSADGYKSEIDKVEDWKNRHCLGFWNKDARDKQKEYINQLMNHVNPYTGIAYKDDPAVAIVEINNENGLLMGYLSGWLENYNGEYWQELEDLWNEWLFQNDYSYEKLSAKFNKHSEKGNFLLNQDSKWNFEKHDGAEATLSTKKDETSIRVTKNGTSSWHVQYNCPKLSMTDNKMYTIKFSAYASKNTTISVGLMQAHDPWKNAGWNQQINLTDKWQTFEFAVENIMNDDNLRLNFGGMGLQAGTTFHFKDISIQEGGDVYHVQYGSKSINNNNTVKLPHYQEYKTLPAELQNIILNFMWEKEADYWLDMKNYIRNEVKSKALIMGTAMSCSTTILQNCFDIIDSHAYWNHPSFPSKSWDMSDYYVKNADLTKEYNHSTLTSLAKYRVYGKPFSVSEYDHPYPNQFNSQCYPMISTFGSFQDWDCIFTFCYTLPKSQNGKNEKITGYFDQGNTPSKACAAPIASRIFRNFLVKPGDQKYYINLNEEKERQNLYKNRSWAIGNPENYGTIPQIAFIHQIGIIVEENETQIDNNFVNVTDWNNSIFDNETFFNDNNEIYYDFNKGIYYVCNENVTVSISNPTDSIIDYPENWKQKNRLLPLTDNKDFATVAAVKEKNNYLIFNCSWCGNAGEKLHIYKTDKIIPLTRENEKLTTDKFLGDGPAYALAAEGNLELFGNRKIQLKKNAGTLWQIITID